MHWGRERAGECGAPLGVCESMYVLGTPYLGLVLDRYSAEYLLLSDSVAVPADDTMIPLAGSRGSIGSIGEVRRQRGARSCFLARNVA